MQDLPCTCLHRSSLAQFSTYMLLAIMMGRKRIKIKQNNEENNAEVLKTEKDLLFHKMETTSWKDKNTDY